MKQPVTQKKLIINNRKFGYFITLLLIKFLEYQLASKDSLPASPSIFADVSSNRNLSKTGPSSCKLL